MILLWAAGCINLITSAERGVLQDRDSDGFTGDIDCDDTDPTVTTRLAFQDEDGDGQGQGGAIEACVPPLGYAATDGDCDDSRDDINTGALEVCDGRDNDCDGQVDERRGIALNGVPTATIREAIQLAGEQEVDPEHPWVVSVCDEVVREILTIDVANLTIRGQASLRPVIDGQRVGSVISVQADGFRLEALEVVQGSASEGGGLNIQAAGAVFENVRIAENDATIHGGGVAILGPFVVSILNSTIEHNTSSRGGGVWLQGGATLFAQGTLISENDASLGGGVGTSGSVTVEDAVISANRADSSGGGVHISNRATFNDVTVLGNSAPQGGGATVAGRLDGSGTVISRNEASEGGGGVFIATGSIPGFLTVHSIDTNQAPLGAGVLAMRDVTINATIIDNHEQRPDLASSSMGGGLASVGAVVTLNTSSIQNNTAHEGGGVWLDQAQLVGLGASSIHDNVAPLGAGVYAASNTALSNLDIHGNQAVGGVGGFGQGGGISCLGDCTLSGISLAGNHAQQAGGGVWLCATCSLEGEAMTWGQPPDRNLPEDLHLQGPGLSLTLTEPEVSCSPQACVP